MAAQHSSDNIRIAKNTLLLYVRMLFMTIISLYTSRIVLQKLGIQDYGIYSTVGGLVMTFTIISDSLATACSRFLNFEMGRSNIQRLRSIVSTSFNIQILLSILVLVVVELLGVWFLNNRLNIPLERKEAANWILQSSMLIFILRLLMVPFHAMIISHEKMQVYAHFSIIEVLLQLLILYVLHLTQYDRLITYGILMLFVTVIVFVFYVIYCHRNFEECTYKVSIEKKVLKELFAFASWNFIGSTSQVVRNQGIDMIVNIFFGVVMNASRGIATQINTALSKFSSSFMNAINPQITKSYALQDINRFKNLVYQGARISFYLLLFLSVPLLCEMEAILNIWLGEVPAEAATFSRLQIIVALFLSLSSTLVTAMLATGNIKRYQISVGLLSIASFPIAWCILKLGAPVYSTYIVIIIIEFCCLIVRLINLYQQTGLRIDEYFIVVIMNVLKVAFVSLIVPVLCIRFIPISNARLLIVVLVSFITTLISIYFVGLNTQERTFVRNKLLNFIRSR